MISQSFKKKSLYILSIQRGNSFAIISNINEINC